MRRPPETGLPGSRAAAPENTANAPFPPEAPQAARAQPPTKFTAKTKMPRAAVHARGAESNRKEERTFPMKPQYFDSQKAAAIIGEPNTTGAALWSTRSQATKQSSSASFCWSLFRAKARKRSASGRSIERAHCMRANEKEGWFAVKKLLLTAGIALTVLLLLGIFLWFGPYGTQLL